jgi:hypothetical protein
MKMNYHTLGPVPVIILGDVIMQCEEQGWLVRFCAFGGMVPVQESSIMKINAQPQLMPGFVLITCKEYPDGELAILPTIVSRGAQ